MTLEIQVLAWDILKTEAHFFCFVCHHHVSCVLNVACVRGLSILEFSVTFTYFTSHTFIVNVYMKKMLGCAAY